MCNIRFMSWAADITLKFKMDWELYIPFPFYVQNPLNWRGLSEIAQVPPHREEIWKAKGRRWAGCNGNSGVSLSTGLLVAAPVIDSCTEMLLRLCWSGLGLC